MTRLTVPSQVSDIHFTRVLGSFAGPLAYGPNGAGRPAHEDVDGEDMTDSRNVEDVETPLL